MIRIGDLSLGFVLIGTDLGWGRRRTGSRMNRVLKILRIGEMDAGLHGFKRD